MDDPFTSAVQQWATLAMRGGHVDAELTLISVSGPQFSVHGWMQPASFPAPPGGLPLYVEFSGTLDQPTLRHPLWYDGRRELRIQHWLAEAEGHRPGDVETLIDPPPDTNERTMTFAGGAATSDHSYVVLSDPPAYVHVTVVFSDPLRLGIFSAFALQERIPISASEAGRLAEG